MPYQMSNSKKWFCRFEGCVYISENYQEVHDHEALKHLFPPNWFENENDLFKDSEKPRLPKEKWK